MAPTIDRRTWLRTAVGFTLGGLAARALHARPADAAVFAKAVEAEPLMRPFWGVTDLSGHRTLQALTTRGRWPAALQGRFHRNGPALFERRGERYHHWFDGDGMVQQWRIDGGRVSHQARLVATSKLMAEQRAGRFLLPAFGTWLEDAPPISGPDSVNVANTSVIEHAGRLMALWEGGSAHELSTHDLSTQGPVAWRADLAGVPFSAHPKVDPQGHLWNIGHAGSRLVIWHIRPSGELAEVKLTSLPFQDGMAHDMAVTRRWLLVPLPPVKLNFQMPTPGPRAFEMVAGEPLRILVLDKNDPSRQRVFELPAEMVFHVANAHETRDGQIELSFIAAPDAGFLSRGAVALMRGKPELASAGRLCTLRLDPVTGRHDLQRHDGVVEFPCIDPRLVGEPARWVAMASTQAVTGRPPSRLPDAVALLDLHTGRQHRYHYGTHVIAEEHLLIPKPGGRHERDAWLMGTTYDSRLDATVLNLLDASAVEDGPIAQAVLDARMPLGFHGHFQRT